MQPLQVLDMAQAQHYSDSDEDDGDYVQLYGYNPDPSAAPGTRGGEASGRPETILDPSDAFFQWRADVEHTLQQVR